MSIPSSALVEGAGPWHVPDLNPAVGGKKESGSSPWEAVATWIENDHLGAIACSPGLLICTLSMLVYLCTLLAPWGVFRCHREMYKTFLEDGTGLAAVLPVAQGGHQTALAGGSFTLGKTLWRYRESHPYCAPGWGMTARGDRVGGFASREQAAGSAHAEVQSHRQWGRTPRQAPAEQPAGHQAGSWCFVTRMSSSTFWRNGPVVGKGFSELADLSQSF